MTSISACFYTPEDYVKLLELSDDRKKMCDTHKDWFEQFMKMKIGLEDEGIEVVPVRVRLDDLQKFCKKNNLKNTGEARSRYASFLSS
ncbi:MAG: hypothetical protein ABI261_05845 [Ginsengibacter sp.]